MIVSEAILQYYAQLKAPSNLPSDVETMNPYINKNTFSYASTFYKKYYSDQKGRFICFGINPGRFGAGVTGVPFTDSIRLETPCEIPNKLDKHAELSSRFIYDMIHAYGGPDSFYSSFYISAVSPLGYVKNGVNLNYYDIKGYKDLFESYACEQIEKQLKFGINTSVAFSIGKGQNVKFLNFINNKYQFFKKIVPLPHPRWVMQYRLKRKDDFIQEYISAFSDSENNY